MPFSRFCDLDIFTGSRNEFVDLFVRDKQRGSPAKIVFSVNGQGLSDYSTDKEFRKHYEKADYIHADGMSVVFGTRLFGTESCTERIATTDWFHDIVNDQRCQNIRHFLLGADEDTLAKTVKKLNALYPHLVIAGYHHGYFTEQEEPLIVQIINDSKADILWVGLGRPKQEEFSTKWRDSLQVVWIKTCGGLFDFISEKNKRAPVLLQNLGLEWAYRMSREPKRLLYRYLKTNCVSVAVMIREGFRNIVKR